MRTTINKTSKFGSLILIMALLFIFIAMAVNSTQNVSALADSNPDMYYRGAGFALSRLELDTATKNTLIVNTNPNITVLTHGLGGNASHWSNDLDKFAYDSSSLIEQLRSANPEGTVVYWAGVQERITVDNDFIYNFLLKKQYEIEYDIEKEKDGNKVISLSSFDIGKHLIVVFEGRSKFSDQGNDDAYDELYYVIDMLLYDLIQLGVVQCHSLIKSSLINLALIAPIVLSCNRDISLIPIL